MELKDSSTIKVEFASNLLPEFLNIGVSEKVKPLTLTGFANASTVLDGVIHRFSVRVKRHAPDVKRTII